MNRPPIAFFGLIAGGLFLWWLSTNSAAAETLSTGVTDLLSRVNWPSGDRIWDVCRAVAQHEGYGKAGDAPTNLNNPGDLSPGDEHGYATGGPAEFHGGSYIIHFATADDGWGALYAKFSNIVNGISRVYSADWTWPQIGQEYAADPNWGAAVAALLGVDPTSTLNDYVGAQ